MARRQPGKGSVIKKANGRYLARLTLEDGSRVSLGTYATEDEADRVRAASVAEIESGFAPRGAMTLGEYGSEWMLKRKHLRNWNHDRGRWQHHVEGTNLASTPLRAIRGKDILAWIEMLRVKKARPRGHESTRPLHGDTIRCCLALVRGCLSAARSADLISENPATGIRAPKVERTHDPWDYLRPEEQTGLITCSAIPRPDRLIIAFAIGSGLRQGEQRALKLEDIVTTGDRPHVMVRYGAPGLPTKSGKPRRVPLFGLALSAIVEWLELLPRYCSANPHELVFPTRDGRHRRRGRMLGRHLPWQTLLAQAGITRPFRWHDLRHTCASSLIAGWWGRAWSLTEVRDLLGHSSVTVTERYAHLSPDALERAARDTAGPLPDPSPRIRRVVSVAQRSPVSERPEPSLLNDHEALPTSTLPSRSLVGLAAAAVIDTEAGRWVSRDRQRALAGLAVTEGVAVELAVAVLGGGRLRTAKLLRLCAAIAEADANCANGEATG